MPDQWTQIEFDEKGYLVLTDREPDILLANAKLNKTASTVSGAKRHSESGNPWFDPRTGRFANGPPGVTVKAGGGLLRSLLNDAKRYITDQVARYQGDAISAAPGQNGKVRITIWNDGAAIVVFDVESKNSPVSQAQPAAKEEQAHSLMPDGVDPEEWHRRMDAVRDAAREFDSMSLQDVREWLQGKTTRELTQAELESFLHDVHQHRLSDLVDVLDTSLRKSLSERFRQRRTVRVVPPRGWVKRTLAGLEDDDIAILYTRLKTRGFSDDDLDKFLIGRYPEERQARLSSLIKRPNKEKSKSEESSSSPDRGQ